MADSVVDSILAARYYRVGEKSFEDVCRRVANALGETPAETEAYSETLMRLEFLPNSPAPATYTYLTLPLICSSDNSAYAVLFLNANVCGRSRCML